MAQGRAVRQDLGGRAGARRRLGRAGPGLGLAGAGRGGSEYLVHAQHRAVPARRRPVWPNHEIVTICRMGKTREYIYSIVRAPRPHLQPPSPPDFFRLQPPLARAISRPFGGNRAARKNEEDYMPLTLGVAAGPLGAFAVPTAAVAGGVVLAAVGAGAIGWGVGRLFDWW